MLHDFGLEVVESPDPIRSRADCRVAHARTIVVPCAVPVRVEGDEAQTQLTLLDEFLAMGAFAPSTLGRLQNPALLGARLFHHDLLNCDLLVGHCCVSLGLSKAFQFCSRYLIILLISRLPIIVRSKRLSYLISIGGGEMRQI